MNNKSIKNNIKERLSLGIYTCVISNTKKIIFTSEKRGVEPLIDFIKSLQNEGIYFLADKVIGKAAALLCVKAKINYVYTALISTPAKSILSRHSIEFEFDSEVPAIQNRTKTGLCPMEGLSRGVTTPDEMYSKVIEWLSAQ